METVSVVIKHQEAYSRSKLLLRTFLGFFYILIPHGFILHLLTAVAEPLIVLTFIIVLFTGKIPRIIFQFQVGVINWNTRLGAALFHLVDEYPQFTFVPNSEQVNVAAQYPKKTSRSLAVVRVLFGIFYIIIPFVFILAIRIVIGFFIVIIAWFAVLFTGRYPPSLHAFQVGTIAIGTQAYMYATLLTDEYPPLWV